MPADTPVPEQRALSPTDWRQLFALGHLDKARAFAAYSEYYRGTSGQIYWSDTHQLSYYDADFEGELQRAAPGYPAGSLMITEVYVPRAVTPAGIDKAQAEFQRLIDRALERGGSYFLTYHRWARKDQVLKAYPQIVEFLKSKRRYDPQERFQSEWYRHYKKMFVEELDRRR